MKKYLAAIMVLLAFRATADTQAGKIIGFMPWTSAGKEMFIFKIDNNPVGGCNFTGRFAIDSTSPVYKTTVAVVVAAFHAQSDIVVGYTKSCTAWENSWDVSYFCTGSVSC